jgi:pimeloyl-ACP methyl ester carboxylesterase
MAAVALAPRDMTSVDGLALLYRERAALARVAWNPHLYDPLLRRRLARITAPTLLCWGAHDRVAPARACAEAWAKEIPGAALRTFAGSGHVPYVEEPEAVAAAVAEFCAAREAR